MNRENLLAWVQDLETTDAGQMQGSLANADRTQFCCLGRLCEIAGITHQVSHTDADDGYTMYGDGEDASGGYLPPEAFEWLGTTEFSAEFNQYRYSDLNDDGATFPEIAAEIRQDFSL